MEQTRRARLTGLTAALLTVAAILWTLFASPSIGVVADGSYASAAEGLALRYAEESIPTGQRVEDFAYEDTAYSTLLFALPNLRRRGGCAAPGWRHTRSVWASARVIWRSCMRC